MREIVFDTETTGLDPAKGDRIVEIGCVELENLIPSGQIFHVYINPERDMPAEAERVHGLSSEFLKDKPVFADVAEEFIRFIGDDSRLVAHNAGFDFNFINMELKRLGRPPLAPERIVDTLALARRKNPGGRNSLDDLCSRYGIDNSRRTKHGALLDSEILAEVYAELLGGRQASLGLTDDMTAAAFRFGERQPAKQRLVPLPSRLSEEDLVAHAAFIATLGGEVVWLEYREG
ncbi:DNA polymerase III subunit epsilon [Agaricicola taiwanensis]|uniref:DNA polymerase III subunit epsilon n=1 Tax=Agaricicola taiwanensis TaxID=591372 RepID=A0A8J2VJG4_9RHOB|nr:DNA polymerase III subunit epsilon [Agaricicola taiwanensis]GGE28851.1 DNA polymerase III subunit epsilon [Agaricicola taiwanensis]